MPSASGTTGAMLPPFEAAAKTLTRYTLCCVVTAGDCKGQFASPLHTSTQNSDKTEYCLRRPKMAHSSNPARRCANRTCTQPCEFRAATCIPRDHQRRLRRCFLSKSFVVHSRFVKDPNCLFGLSSCRTIALGKGDRVCVKFFAKRTCPTGLVSERRSVPFVPPLTHLCLSMHVCGTCQSVLKQL